MCDRPLGPRYNKYMRHATHSLRSFLSPWPKWAVRGLAAAPLVLCSIPAARGADPVTAGPAAAAVPATQPAARRWRLPRRTSRRGRSQTSWRLIRPSRRAPARSGAGRSLPRSWSTTFGTVGGRPGDTWLGRSIQQSVLTDLISAAGSQVTTTTESPADGAAALDLGKKLDAGYVVFGQVHVNNNGVRVTGEIVATDTERPVAALKATGSMNDLFPIEDLLGNQARRALGKLQFADGRAGNGPGAGNATPAEPPAIEPSGPVQVVPVPVAPQEPYSYAPYPVVGAASPAVGYDPYPVYSLPGVLLAVRLVLRRGRSWIRRRLLLRRLLPPGRLSPGAMATAAATAASGESAGAGTLVGSGGSGESGMSEESDAPVELASAAASGTRGRSRRWPSLIAGIDGICPGG